MVPTNEEKDFLRDYFVAECLIEQLEEDRITFPSLPFKLPEVYVHLIDHVLIELRKEQKERRIRMRKENLKIHPHFIDGIMIQVPYTVKGYEGFFRFWDAALHNYINRKLCKKLGV